MGNGINKILIAIKSRWDEKTRDRREFKARQTAIFNEGLIQFKLREQLQAEVTKMDNDPTITGIKVMISPDAIPFLDTILFSLNCKTQTSPIPGEVILIKQEDYL